VKLSKYPNHSSVGKEMNVGQRVDDDTGDLNQDKAAPESMNIQVVDDWCDG
jgi:hypothetical protein